MQIVDQLVASGSLSEKQFTSLQDRSGSAYKLLDRQFATDQLNPGDFFVLKYIVRSMLALEGCSLDVLLQHVYNTEPMQNVERNQKLDMDQVNNTMPGPFEGIDLEQIALSEYAYEHGQCITLEELWRELQHSHTASHSGKD
jgi:hypothetical protein